MRLALVGTLAVAMALLLVARYAPAPIWVDALWLCGGSAGLALAILLGLVARQLSRQGWQAWASLILGGAALAARSSLLSHVLSDDRARLHVDFWSMSLAATTVVWGLLALIWGSLAVSDAWEHAAIPAPTRWVQLLAGSLAVAASLYSVAPLFALAGLRANIWTVVGLFIMALAAYALGTASRALTRRERPRRFR